MLYRIKSSILSIAAFVFFTGLIMMDTSALAQPREAGNDIPAIEVTGTAEVEIVPDEIFVDIIIQERYESREKLTLDMQEDKLKAALAEIGIDLKNLSLTTANAAYVRVKWKNKDVMARKTYKLKLSDAATVGRMFEQLDKLDMDNAYISKMSHSRIDSIKREMRIKAIKAAKDKAAYLLTAIDAKPGKPLLVQERDYGEAMPVAFAANYTGGQSQDAEAYRSKVLIGEVRDVQLKMIKVQSSIFVKFQIQ